MKMLTLLVAEITGNSNPTLLFSSQNSTVNKSVKKFQGLFRLKAYQTDIPK